MYCPECGAEYRANFTMCSDCQVALVAKRPGESPEAEGAEDVPELSEDGAFALVWSGADPRRHAEASEALEQAKIPSRTVSRDDHLIYAVAHPGFEIYVPSEFLARAKQALAEANASPEGWEQLAASGALEIPAEDDAPEEDAGGYRESTEWLPEDTTAEVWSGEDADTAEMIATCLQENRIRCRRTSAEENAGDAPGAERVLVLPQDEARARKIVREIVEAAPE
jgi:hypothetical protein